MDRERERDNKRKFSCVFPIFDDLGSSIRERRCLCHRGSGGGRLLCMCQSATTPTTATPQEHENLDNSNTQATATPRQKQDSDKSPSSPRRRQCVGDRNITDSEYDLYQYSARSYFFFFLFIDCNRLPCETGQENSNGIYLRMRYDIREVQYRRKNKIYVVRVSVVKCWDQKELRHV